MNIKVEFDKLGQGCAWCAAKPAGCGGCSRNPNLIKLKDNFVRLPKVAPRPNVPDDSAPKVSQANARTLAEYGIKLRQPEPPPASPPPAPQQEPPPADVPAPDLGS